MAASKRASGHDALFVNNDPRLPLGGIPAAPPINDRPVGAPQRWRHKRTYQYAPDGRCHSGDACRQDAREGSRFCATHGDELARIREEFERDEAGAFRV